MKRLASHKRGYLHVLSVKIIVAKTTNAGFKGLVQES